MMEELLAYNKQFVEEKSYEFFSSEKYPRKKIAVLTCMDPRLVELLPAALDLKNGDAVLIKNAGAIIMDPFGSVIYSLLIAIFELGVEEIVVIGHTDCGVGHLDSQKILDQMLQRGIREEIIHLLTSCGVDFGQWLAGFDTVEQSVSETVSAIQNHPLIPGDVCVEGYVMDSVTGALTKV